MLGTVLVATLVISPSEVMVLQREKPFYRSNTSRRGLRSPLPIQT